MRDLVAKARIQCEQLAAVAGAPGSPPALARLAEGVLDAYRSAKAGRLRPADIRVTANHIAAGLRDGSVTAEDVHDLICPAFLGLFQPKSPVIFLGLELGFDTANVETLPNFLLECVYLPLLHHLELAGQPTTELVAAIASRPAWARLKASFCRNPNAFYQVRDGRKYWMKIDQLMQMAGLGRLQDACLTDRRLKPFRSMGPTVRVTDAGVGLQAELLSVLQQEGARVLVVLGRDDPEAVEYLASAFLGKAARRPAFTSRLHGVEEDGGCPVVYSSFPTASLTRTYRQQVADAIRAEVWTEADKGAG